MAVDLEHSTGPGDGEPVEVATPAQPPKTAATVLQVLPALETGGVERGTIEIAQAIVAAGGRAIVASEGGRMVHELARAGAEHVELPLASKSPLTIHANIARLEHLIREKNVHLVHARSRAPAWSAYYAAKRAGRPFITTFHGTYNHHSGPKRLYNSIMTRGERVIAISRFIAAHMMQYYGVPARRIRVIPRGVDIARFSPDVVSAERVIALAKDWFLAEGLPVVALPGRLTRWKGQRVFIDAIAKLGRTDLQCLLIGSDQGRRSYKHEVEALIADRGLTGVIRVVDDCRDMPAAYMLSDLVVSASTDPEAFGRVLAEAQAMGRPVIGSDHGGARETVLPEETGWLVKPGDAQQLADAIARALALEPGQRQRIAARAADHVRRNFSKQDMCNRTLAVYDEVLNLAPSS